MNIDETYYSGDAYSSYIKANRKSNIRSRRPTEGEIKLVESLRLKEKHHETTIPYADIFEFSIYSCMRIESV